MNTRNKNYEYKMTIDGREIGGSVNGPQATAAEVVALMKAHNPKAENVIAVEVKAAEPAPDDAEEKTTPPTPTGEPKPTLPNLGSVLTGGNAKPQG